MVGVFAVLDATFRTFIWSETSQQKEDEHKTSTQYAEHLRTNVRKLALHAALMGWLLWLSSLSSNRGDGGSRHHRAHGNRRHLHATLQSIHCKLILLTNSFSN